MNGECNVARDLMPLCIDGAASEESRAYVEGHVVECESCRAYYEEMKGRLPDRLLKRVAEEGDVFARAAARMRRRRVLKRALLILLIAAVLAGGALWYFTYGTLYEREMPASWYDVTLSRLENGEIVATLRMKREIQPSMSGGDGRADGRGRHLYMDYFALDVYHTKGYVVRAIRLGDGELFDFVEYGRENAVIWRRGEGIAPASEEMEAYYRAVAELTAFEKETERRHMIAMAEAGDYSETYELTEAEKQRRETLNAAVQAAKAAVPEWGAGDETVIRQIDSIERQKMLNAWR